MLDRLVADGGDPAEIVEREDLGAMGDSGELAGIVAKVIEDNPDVVERIRGGNAKAMGALVGPIMRETKGKADGGEVNRLIREQLGVVYGRGCQLIVIGSSVSSTRSSSVRKIRRAGPSSGGAGMVKTP